jgi:hypothetical protein
MAYGRSSRRNSRTKCGSVSVRSPLWKQSKADAFYVPPLNPVAGTTGTQSHYIGQQWIASVEWSATPQLTVAATYVHYEPAMSPKRRPFKRILRDMAAVQILIDASGDRRVFECQLAGNRSRSGPTGEDLANDISPKLPDSTSARSMSLSLLLLRILDSQLAL